MKVTTLIENTSCRENLTPEHGLSLYLETGGHRILFDMGQSDAFVRNAQKLNADLTQVDMAVLSHGHYDHGGGMEAFLQSNQMAPIYIHEAAFGNYYNGTQKYIGLKKSLRAHPRFIFTKGALSLTPNLTLMDCNALGWQADSWGLISREGDSFFPDSFHHEQYLEIKEGSKRILISGCSHKGILNIAGHFQPDVLIGGFHLNKETDTDRLRKIAEKLLAGSTVYYTGHCTGDRQYTVMKEVMGERLQRLSTGLTLQI